MKSQANTTKSKSNVNVASTTTEDLPKELQHLVPAELTKEELAAQIEAFQISQREKFEAKLVERISDFESKIKDRSSREARRLVLKITLSNTNAQMQTLRAAKKRLKAELKELSPRKAKQVKDVTEQHKAELEAKANKKTA